MELIDVFGKVICQLQSISQREFPQVHLKSTVMLSLSLTHSAINLDCVDIGFILQGKVLTLILRHLAKSLVYRICCNLLKLGLKSMKEQLLNFVEVFQMCHEPKLEILHEGLKLFDSLKVVRCQLCL